MCVNQPRKKRNKITLVISRVVEEFQFVAVFMRLYIRDVVQLFCLDNLHASVFIEGYNRF